MTPQTDPLAALRDAGMLPELCRDIDLAFECMRTHTILHHTADAMEGAFNALAALALEQKERAEKWEWIARRYEDICGFEYGQIADLETEYAAAHPTEEKP